MDDEHLVVNLDAEVVGLDDEEVLAALLVAGEVRVGVLAVVLDLLLEVEWDEERKRRKRRCQLCRAGRARAVGSIGRT